LIDLCGVSATFNVALASFNTNTRILFSFGKNQKTLKLGFLAKTDKKQGTPIYAILVFAVILTVVSLSLGLYAGSPNSTIGAWTAYAWYLFIYLLFVNL
jgi:amino acid transporter